ncbi:uncharacterized protein FIBRA_01321 [Fibroporia radiculosa]|uniref:Uncharacterized protein n=1 Tax=Fibroporia radiculosa TaxID=599839 RepID=J4GJV1_9APHY|nr:uncharacterized protein FIBRA_01321 [Fibroporia radiculosa]CCL99305.1 predicted protein [Fibroporia radiculosa]
MSFTKQDVDSLQSKITSNTLGVAIFTLIVYEELVAFDEIVALFREKGRVSITVFTLNQLNMSVYALANILCVPSWGTVASNGIMMSFRTSDIASFSVCVVDAMTPHTPRLGTLAQSCTVAGDLVVVAVTWISLYRSDQFLPDSYFRVPGTLARLLLRDGTIYFLALSVLNLVDIITYWSDHSFQYVRIFNLPLSSILISRLVLHLREMYAKNAYFNSQSISVVRTQDVEQIGEEVPKARSMDNVFVSNRRIGFGQNYQHPIYGVTAYSISMDSVLVKQGLYLMFKINLHPK